MVGGGNSLRNATMRQQRRGTKLQASKRGGKFEGFSLLKTSALQMLGKEGKMHILPVCKQHTICLDDKQ